MAKRKQTRRRSFNCKKCRFKGTGPSTLSAHYGKHPTHRPNGPVAELEQAALELARPGRKGWRYCPHCGKEQK